jgi:RND family efflux transporter MFP subunit
MRWVGLAGIGLLGLVTACSEEAPPEVEVVRPVKIFEVGSGAGQVRRVFPGTITSEAEAEVGFEVQGRVTEFPVEEGEKVEPGDLIAKLDARDYETRLDKARVQANDMRADFDRAQSLFDQGVLAEAERDHRQAGYQVAQADVREAQKAVDDATLRAPVAGTIARKLVRAGESVQAKQPVLIFQTDTDGGMEIEIAVPEREVAGGTPGLSPAQITARVQPVVVLAAVPDRPMDARITEFATSADPSTRTFKATLAFDPPDDLQVLPGMTAKVSISAPRETPNGDAGLTVPAVAVAADESGESFVWRIDREAMTASKTPVELGALGGDSVEVRSGLSDGDWVALSGVHQLREGMTVSRLGR